MTTKEKKGINISTKSFLTAIVVLFLLMVLTYGLTFVIPGGEYARILDETGNSVLDSNAGFRFTESGIPFWKWILSPILVLGAEGNGALIAIIAFLLIIGGIFNSLDKCGLMKYMLDRITDRFGQNKYRLMAVVVLFFMSMGSFIGSFEECVPLVPIVVALSIRLGWDALVGLGMSLLAAGCGFAAGICNPFTVGVAQELAGLAMFSGIWMRVASFILIYILLMLFLIFYSRKIEKTENVKTECSAFQAVKEKDKGVLCFAGILGCGIVLVLSSVFIPFLQDLTMIIVAVMFLAAGVTACLASGMGKRQFLSGFFSGLVSIFPAVFMILMANSIKYTMVEANILDTILYYAVETARGLPGWMVVLFLYFVALVLNFFISSGSAKAFLLIPLIVPMAQLFGISPQLCILAYVFGDGFSNVFYPTNPVLLISLGVADVDYGKWFRWSGVFQAANLLLTSGILLFGFYIGY